MKLQNNIKRKLFQESGERLEKIEKRSQVFTIAFSFFIIFILASNEQCISQTTIVSEGFNNTLTQFTFTGTGAFYTGNSATGDRPASSPFAIEGTHSGGVTNGTLTLSSIADINTSAYTGIQLSLRAAAFSISSTSSGVDLSDKIIIQISTNSGGSYTPILTVNGCVADAGTNDAWWAYSATGIATAAYPTPATFTPAGSGARTIDGYSTLTITSLPATPTLRVRIIANNNSANERYVIDDFKITGTLVVPTVASFTPGNGCANATPVTITGTNFTGATAVKFGGTDAVSFTVNSATQITATPAGGTTGTISVTGTNGTGTSATTFTVNALPVSSVPNQTNISCFAANDGTITVSASGGTGPYFFSDDNGTSFFPSSPNPGTSTWTFTGLIPNNPYTIKVKDNIGCISK